MFADFENMIKGKINSIKETTTTDISRVPQKYNIKGRIVQQLKLLSQGSFGFIWLAEDINTKQKFALKRIVCITNDRFQLAKNQLDLMLKFPKSKNIVACYGGQIVTLKNGHIENKVLIILMEYCPNGTLFDLLSSRENKGFNQKQLLQIAISIFQGLKCIHQIGCYHQDVKIENVLIGKDNTFKLCDFGSCSNRFIDFRTINKSEYGTIKQQMEAVTTPMYRPPEIVDPYLQYEVSYKVDVWMVGCVLYTLSYFTHPFVDSNAVGIAGGVYRFPNYPDETKYQTSQKMKDFIRNLLTPNPTYRPSVQQSLDILHNWYTFTQIPLNVQAKRRKAEERLKERQLQKLNKKVVDFDGDIPMDKLLEIQMKLKNKQTKQVTKPTFITNTETKLIKDKTPTLVGNTNQQNIFNFAPNPQQKQKSDFHQTPKQETVNANSFWNTNTTNSTTSADVNKTKPKFDDFASFLPSSNEPKKASNSNDQMYNFFFANDGGKQSQIIQTKANKKNQTNLLQL